MPLFCNKLYLKAAIADFTNFQRMCRFEWHSLRRWYDMNNLQMYGVSPNRALRAYFLAAANIFESNRAAERLAWSQTAMLAEALSSYIQSNDCAPDLREGLISKLTADHHNILPRGAKDSAENDILHVIDELIMNLGVFNNGADNLREAWKDWLMTWNANNKIGSCESSTALLIIRTVEVCSGRYGLDEQDPKDSEYYTHLEQLSSSICRQLGQLGRSMENTEHIDRQVDLEMRELAQHVLQISGNNTLSRLTKQTFLHVVKSFSYVAVCSDDTIDFHIFKVIFEDVIKNI